MGGSKPKFYLKHQTEMNALWDSLLIQIDNPGITGGFKNL